MFLFALIEAASQVAQRPLAYTLEEAAEVTGHSTRTLRRLVRRHLIHPSRATSRLIFSRAEIERFLNETTSI
jgi:predicted site-specific integrase-resolvase